MGRQTRRQYLLIRLRTNHLMGGWLTQTSPDGSRRVLIGEGHTPEEARSKCIGAVLAWVAKYQPNTLIHWEDLVL